MAAPSTTYKLIILELLSRLGEPLTNAQIADFFLEREYTTYFNVQTALSELLDSELITSEQTRKSTRYHLTAAGADTLRFLSDKLSDDVRDDIDRFLTSRGFSIREENALLSDYYRATEGGYMARLQYREKGKNVIDLTLALPNKEAAEAACKNWQDTNGDLYAYLLDLLVK